MSLKYPACPLWTLKPLVCLFVALLAPTGLSQNVIKVEKDSKVGKKEGKKFSDDRIIVKFKPAATPDQIAQLNREFGGKTYKKFKRLPSLHVVTVPKGSDILALCKQYLDSGLVISAEPDYLLETFQVNDPGFINGFQWPLVNTGQSNGTNDCDIDAVEAWNLQQNASNVVVAVIDTGLRLTHQDIAGNLWTNSGEIAGNGIDDDDNDIIDDVHGIVAVANPISGDPTDMNTGTYHGSHVSGIIGAVGNNSVGITGVAVDVQIMALKAGTGSSLAIVDVIECIGYAVENGADIINGSFGGNGFSQGLEDAIEDARSEGVIFVAAAGNANSDNDITPFYPASIDVNNVVSVMATDRRDRRAAEVTPSYAIETYYSNIGQTSVDLAAPGGAIVVTRDGGGAVISKVGEVVSLYGSADNTYAYISGTSQAAPHVAGVLALVRARFPSDDYLHAIDRVLLGVDRPASLDNLCVTEGRLNANRALRNLGITSVTPSTIAQGAQLTILGSGFDTPGRVVRVGGVVASSVTQISDSEIRVIVPASTPVGSSTVEVTLPGIRSSGFVLQGPAPIQVTYPPYTFSSARIDEQGDIDDFTAVATIAPGGMSAYLEVSYNNPFNGLPYGITIETIFTIDYVSGPDYFVHDYYSRTDDIFFSVSMSRNTHVSAYGSIWVDFDTGTSGAWIY